MDLEPLYLYILSKLPIKDLAIFSGWKEKAGSFEKVVKGSSELWLSLRINSELQSKLTKIIKDISIEKVCADMSKENIFMLPYYDQLYPKLLKEIFDPPAVLFYKGKFITTDEACIGIVGTRLMSSYGKAVISKIASPLIDSGCTIISGLAYGVDAAAHSEAVKRKARTIAVLGSGLDAASLYPKQHLRLTQEILDNNGLLISEHPPGEPAFKQHFIARNRIIAGMSLGTVVVECKPKSGALITADYAMDFNRPVYAVPGPIYSTYSEGPHELIKQGAQLITNGEDILEDLKIALTKPNAASTTHTPLEQRVLKCIQSNPKSFDALLAEIKITSGELQALLTTMELENKVKNLGTERYLAN